MFGAISDSKSESDDSLDPRELSPIAPSNLTSKTLTISQSNENDEIANKNEDFERTNEDSNDCVVVDSPYAKEKMNVTNTAKTKPLKRPHSQSIFDKYRSQPQCHSCCSCSNKDYIF